MYIEKAVSSVLNVDSMFGFCYDSIEHDKQRQHVICDLFVGQLCVYLKTRLLEHTNLCVEFHL